MRELAGPIAAMVVVYGLGAGLGYSIRYEMEVRAEPTSPERVYMACDSVILPIEHLGQGLSYTNFLAECDIYNPEEIEQ